MIEKLKYRIKIHPDNGLFHDTRGDVSAIAKYLIILTNKINEIVDVVNSMQSNGGEKND